MALVSSEYTQGVKDGIARAKENTREMVKEVTEKANWNAERWKKLYEDLEKVQEENEKNLLQKEQEMEEAVKKHGEEVDTLKHIIHSVAREAQEKQIQAEVSRFVLMAVKKEDLPRHVKYVLKYMTSHIKDLMYIPRNATKILNGGLEDLISVEKAKAEKAKIIHSRWLSCQEEMNNPFI